VTGIYRDPAGAAAIRTAAAEALAAWPVPAERRTLETRLGPTHVATTGDGPAVVLVPGTNLCAGLLGGLVGRLSATSRVHAVDLPGQPGLSHDQRPTRASGGYGAWFAQLLDRLGDAEVVVVGHSLGARVAMSGVARIGSRVRGLVLVDPAGLLRLAVTRRVLRPTLPWLRHPDDATSAALLAMMMAPGAAPDPRTTAWMTLVGRHVRTSLAPAPLDGATLAALGQVPTAVLSGEHDAFLPPLPLARAAARRLPTARVTVARDAGHLVPEERPDAVEAMVAELRAG
jgi:pimeloyl-ACP methyl ester carboxylesterase